MKVLFASLHKIPYTLPARWMNWKLNRATRKEGGLPLDCFREFIKSHSTRLTNRLTASLSVPEKNLLRQRKENMRVAKELYIDLQRKALDIPAPSKDIGLER